MSTPKPNQRIAVDPAAPRYDLVQRPLSIQEAADRKNERVKEAWDEYQRVLAEPLETHASEFKEVPLGSAPYDSAIFGIEQRTYGDVSMLIADDMLKRLSESPERPDK